jgi:hypothetical protein
MTEEVLNVSHLGIVLYRGIKVPKTLKNRVVDEIKSEGLSQKLRHDRSRPMSRSKRQALYKKESLSTEDTRPSNWIEREALSEEERRSGVIGRWETINAEPIVFASADYWTAAYYAAVHHDADPDSTGLVIEFQINELRQLVIDGRDALYNLVAFPRTQKSEEALVRIYGPSIKKYLARAWSSEDRDFRNAILDLATEDPKVIRDHLRNESVVKGRHGVHFCSSFSVSSPIPAKEILSLSEVCCFRCPSPEIDYYTLAKTARRIPAD